VGTALYDHLGDGADNFDAFENEKICVRLARTVIMRKL